MRTSHGKDLGQADRRDGHDQIDVVGHARPRVDRGANDPETKCSIPFAVRSVEIAAASRRSSSRSANGWVPPPRAEVVVLRVAHWHAASQQSIPLPLQLFEYGEPFGRRHAQERLDLGTGALSIRRQGCHPPRHRLVHRRVRIHDWRDYPDTPHAGTTSTAELAPAVGIECWSPRSARESEGAGRDP